MFHGQGKPQNGQGNVREKSGNFVRAHGWTPCTQIVYDLQLLATLIGNHLTREPTASAVLTKC